MILNKFAQNKAGLEMTGYTGEPTLTMLGAWTWRVLHYLCAFQGDERHLGHVVKADKWHAYDATHLNAQEDGIRYLGDFSDITAAKAAVEASVASLRGQKAQRANAQMPAWIF